MFLLDYLRYLELERNELQSLHESVDDFTRLVVANNSCQLFEVFLQQHAHGVAKGRIGQYVNSAVSSA